MLTKKDLLTINKLFDKKLEPIHKAILGVDKRLQAIHKDLLTKKDLKEYIGNLRKDMQELSKLLHIYMELTKIYREQQEMLEKEVQEILADLGYIEN